MGDTGPTKEEEIEDPQLKDAEGKAEVVLVKSDVRYRVVYKNEDGKVIEKGPYTVTHPTLTEDPEEAPETTDPAPVLDINIHVTIRDIVETKAINNEEDAVKAGNDQPVDTAKTGTGSDKGPGRRFMIRSINQSEMIIRSPILVKALRSVVDYYPLQEVNGETISVDEPYFFILHTRSALQRYVQRVEAGETNEIHDGQTARVLDEQEKTALVHDFKVLQAFLDAKWGKKIEKEEARYNLSTPKATHEMLWMLLKPGTPVFATLDGEPGGYIVRSLKLDPSDNSYRVSLWNLSFNGSILDRIESTFWMFSYEGEREISSLAIYPLELKLKDKTVPLNPQVQTRLEERGEKFWGFLQAIFQRGSVEISYDGELAGDSAGTNYNGRAIIDPNSFYNHSGIEHPNWIFDNDNAEEDDEEDYESGKKKKPMWFEYQIIGADRWKAGKTNLGKLHFFLCPSTVGGFCLKQRQFKTLRTDCLKPTTVDEAALKTLQIPQERLAMIIALTHKYEGKEKTWSADHIQNKGEGQIFLLHGPSGVGKTYTAECIARYTGRPLLSLTVADIGTDEAEMEKELAKWFGFSETWEAIMLIDEADVYFERRASGQLQRNSLVSAFLRSMEYYRGILFLTTNRLGHIDDAILGRIHLIIEYSDLDDKDRLEIWKQFFRKLTLDRPNYVVDDYLESFVENDEKVRGLRWNGREIRNAFQTAVALAEYHAKTSSPPKEKVIVTKKHLEVVADMSAAFKKYIDKFKGDEAKRAYLDGARMDEGVRLKREQLDLARKAARVSRENTGDKGLAN